MLVVGLGNPGPRYAETRHNIGFRVVDHLEGRAGSSFRERFNGWFANAEIAGDAVGRSAQSAAAPITVGLLKPATFMNDSGRSVQPAMQFYKLKPAEVLVVYDELDLPFGELRLKSGGGHAGHRGVKSITEAIGADTLRLRVGIGRPPPEFRGAVADFVLQGFAAAERVELDNVIDRAAKAVTLVVTRGLEVAMNATNQRQSR
jgi:PTH1 family peptidyl-tRNA hydrolase